MTDGAPHEYKEKTGTCPECGNSPVNHFEHYISSTLAIWTADALERGAGPRAFVARWSSALFDAVEQILLRALAAMPFARYSSRIELATTYRSQVVWEEAARRGIRMEQVFLFGRGTEVYRADIGGRWFFFQSLPIPPWNKTESGGWLDDKYLLKRRLASAGIPTPRVRTARTLVDAEEAVASLDCAVVIKPRSGSRGRHTTVNVRDASWLRESFETAKRLCPYVAVEEYLQGPVCRGTVVGGVLVGFFCADAPCVVGDGISTIEQLVERNNARKPARVGDIRLTEEHGRFLSRLGFAPDSVLPAGETVPLTHRTGRLFGGSTREMLGNEHPKLRGYLEKAAKVLDVSVVGFDLIVPDPSADPDAQRWGIIEANSLPYIDLHYLALAGEPSNVAAAVWDLWLSPIHSAAVDAPIAGVTMST